MPSRFVLLRTVFCVSAVACAGAFSQTPAGRTYLSFPWEAPHIVLVALALVISVPAMLGSYALSLDAVQPPPDNSAPET